MFLQRLENIKGPIVYYVPGGTGVLGGGGLGWGTIFEKG